MSNIKKAFENGKAFIAFITCGDPDLETTAAAIRAAVETVRISLSLVSRSPIQPPKDLLFRKQTLGR